MKLNIIEQYNINQEINSPGSNRSKNSANEGDINLPPDVDSLENSGNNLVVKKDTKLSNKQKKQDFKRKVPSQIVNEDP